MGLSSLIEKNFADNVSEDAGLITVQTVPIEDNQGNTSEKTTIQKMKIDLLASEIAKILTSNNYIANAEFAITDTKGETSTLTVAQVIQTLTNSITELDEVKASNTICIGKQTFNINELFTEIIAKINSNKKLFQSLFTNREFYGDIIDASDITSYFADAPKEIKDDFRGDLYSLFYAVLKIIKKVKTDYASNSGGASAPQIPSDWNQNDSGAVDYIKNRPFYKRTFEATLDETKENERVDVTELINAASDGDYVYDLCELVKFADYTGSYTAEDFDNHRVTFTARTYTSETDSESEETDSSYLSLYGDNALGTDGGFILIVFKDSDISLGEGVSVHLTKGVWGMNVAATVGDYLQRITVTAMSCDLGKKIDVEDLPFNLGQPHSPRPYDRDVSLDINNRLVVNIPELAQIGNSQCFTDGAVDLVNFGADYISFEEFINYISEDNFAFVRPHNTVHLVDNHTAQSIALHSGLYGLKTDNNDYSAEGFSIRSNTILYDAVRGKSIFEIIDNEHPDGILNWSYDGKVTKVLAWNPNADTGGDTGDTTTSEYNEIGRESVTGLVASGSGTGIGWDIVNASSILIAHDLAFQNADGLDDDSIVFNFILRGDSFGEYTRRIQMPVSAASYSHELIIVSKNENTGNVEVSRLGYVAAGSDDIIANKESLIVFSADGTEIGMLSELLEANLTDIGIDFATEEAFAGEVSEINYLEIRNDSGFEIDMSNHVSTTDEIIVYLKELV